MHTELQLLVSHILPGSTPILESHTDRDRPPTCASLDATGNTFTITERAMLCGFITNEILFSWPGINFFIIIEKFTCDAGEGED